jgi:hypothetical protein
MKVIAKSTTIVVVVMLAIQLIPYGHKHLNPPVTREPNWHAPKIRELAKIACFDCHSNESVWPWYSRIAPVSWLIAYDVQAGRNKLNFSDWQGSHRPAESADKMVKEIIDGEMPPFQYRLAHPSARLSEEDRKSLIEGLQATKSKIGARDR